MLFRPDTGPTDPTRPHSDRRAILGAAFPLYYGPNTDNFCTAPDQVPLRPLSQAAHGRLHFGSVCSCLPMQLLQVLVVLIPVKLIQLRVVVVVTKWVDPKAGSR